MGFKRNNKNQKLIIAGVFFVILALVSFIVNKLDQPVQIHEITQEYKLNAKFEI